MMTEPTSRKPPSRKSRLRRLFPLLALLLPLGAMEAGLRVYDAARGANSIARAHWYWAFEQDRLLGFRPRPGMDFTFAGGTNRFDSNSVGLRDAETPLEADGRRLIICLGESSTWGTGCTDQSTTWPNRLEAKLAERGFENFVVLNAGIPGYTTVENLQFLKLSLLKYEPEAILYMGMRNDFVEYGGLGETADFNRFPRRLAALPRTPLQDLLMSSSVVAALYSQLGARMPLDPVAAAETPKTAGSATGRAASLFADQIALMKTLCDRRDVRLFWIDQPVNVAALGDARPLNEEWRTVLHEALREQGIPLLDAHDLYDHEAAPMLDDVHFSDAGNDQLAEIVANQLEDANWLSAPERHDRGDR